MTTINLMSGFKIGGNLTMKFKQGQTVYYFIKFPACVILSGTVTGVKKDLVTREIIYTIKKDYNLTDISFGGDSYVDVKEKVLYASKEKLEKLHRDEIAYDKLNRELSEVKRILEEIKLKVDSSTVTLDNMYFNDLKHTATITNSDIVISDFGSITEKIKKLEKEVSSIKKKIKTSKK